MSYLLKHLKENKHTGLFRKSTYETQQTHVKAFTEKDSEGKTLYILRVKFADFGTIDNSRDMMQQGAFARSIEASTKSRRKIAFCWQHDKKDPIGKIRLIEETPDGAFCEVVLSDFDAVPNAKRAWAQVLDGTLDQASFGYNYVWDTVRYVPEDETTDEQGYWIVGEVILWEISLVTHGDNENTGVEEFYEEQQRKSMAEGLFKKENVISALKTLDDKEVKEYLKSIGVKEEKRGLFSRQ